MSAGRRPKIERRSTGLSFDFDKLRPMDDRQYTDYVLHLPVDKRQPSGQRHASDFFCQ